MIMIKEKIIIHIDTTIIKIFSLANNNLTLVKTIYLNLNFTNTDTLLKHVYIFLDTLTKYTKVIDNKNVKIYATGIFQQLPTSDKNYFINSIFIDYGLYFYIVNTDLENFYLKNCLCLHTDNLIQSILHQEFRSVVICGSFQQFLPDIEQLIVALRRQGTDILSPKSTKVKPETAGANFVLFEYQDCLKNERDTWRHKYEHMTKFDKCDAVIICNPDGIVGRGTIFEFGYMVAISRRIIFTHQPINISVSFPFEVGLNFYNTF